MLAERDNFQLLSTNETGFDIHKPHEIIEAYLDVLGHDKQELKQYASVLPRMPISTVGVVVAVAKNEEQNIEGFIQSVAEQNFPKETGLNPQNFEVLIVVNNSTDETLQVGRYYRDKIRPPIPTYIIQKDFPEPLANLGSARKFGNDLSSMRMMSRNRVLNLPYDESYLFSLDVDNRIPKNFLSSGTQLFRLSQAEAIGGELNLFAIDDYAHEGTPNYRWLGELYRNQSEHKQSNNSSRHNTHGNASAVTAHAHALAGGIQAFSPGQDSQLRDKLEMLGIKVVGLKGRDTVLQNNPRRMLSDPHAFISVNPKGRHTVAYQPEKFHSIQWIEMKNGLISSDMPLVEAERLLHVYAKYISILRARKTGLHPDNHYEAILSNLLNAIKEIGAPFRI